MSMTKVLREKINTRVFRFVHGRHLIYNTCWEDPALDRIALNLSPSDRVVVITSAGCNALDYLLAGAGQVHAVDVNPIQNALLELKVAGLRTLDHEAFFELFGHGRSPRARDLYFEALRIELSPVARRYWDRHINFFEGKGWRRSFYYRGTSGLLARLVLFHTQSWRRLRRPLENLLQARTVAEQREIYESCMRDRMWSRSLRWLLERSTTMSLLGIPEPQRQQIQSQYPGGVAQFARDAVTEVITQLPIADNYFWRVYIQGSYEPDCCPEYLKRENFDGLRDSLDRLTIETTTLTRFLRETAPGISKFVLLDHMDWMSARHPQALIDEWHTILRAARPGARVIFRSGGLKVDYLDHLRVNHRGRTRTVGELLRYHPELAAQLHARDRVHTYGCFCIADLPDDTGA